MAFDGIKNGHVHLEEDTVHGIVNKSDTPIGTIITGGSKTVTLTANAHYVVPTTVDYMYVIGITGVNSDWGSSYTPSSASNPTSATFSFKADGTGHVTISGTLLPRQYSITCPTPPAEYEQVDLGKVKSMSIETVAKTCTITLKTGASYAGYDYPWNGKYGTLNTPNVATTTYSSTNGEFYLTKATGNVEISMSPGRKKRTLSSKITNATYQSMTDDGCYAEKQITVTYEMEDYYKMPNSVGVTNSNELYVYPVAVTGKPKQFTITFTPDGSNNTCEASGDCIKTAYKFDPKGVTNGTLYYYNGSTWTTQMPDMLAVDEQYKFKIEATTGYKANSLPGYSGCTITDGAKTYWTNGETSDVRVHEFTIKEPNNTVILNAYSCWERTWNVIDAINNGSVK